MRTVTASKRTGFVRAGRSALIQVVCAACLIGLAALGVVVPSVGVIGVLAVVLVVLCLTQVAIPVVLLIFLAFATFPASVPDTVSASGFTVGLYEPLALLLAIFAFPACPRGVQHAVLAGLGFLAVFSLVGLLRESTVDGVLQDTRRLAILIIAIPIGWFALERVRSTRLLQGLVVTLWFSAGVSVAASIGILEIDGRVRAASLALGEVTGSSAVRLQTPTTYLAVAVLSGIVAWCLLFGFSERRARRWMLALGVPASAIFVFGFARNAVLTLLVAAVFVLVTRGSRRMAQPLARGFGLVVAVGAAGIFVRLLLSGTASAEWIDLQATSFATRVLGGLTPSGISGDSSVQFRLQQENPYLFAAIRESPVFGHGFGYAYKPLFTGRAFSADVDPEGFRQYAHNFYLWTAVKCGAVGLLAVLVPLLRLGRQSLASDRATALFAPTLGLLVASLVAPMPTGSPTSLLLGLLFGATYSYLPDRGTQEREANEAAIS